jgi:cytidylate kinase
MREIAHEVGARLGFAVVDEEIVLRAAAAAEVEPDVVADVERRRSFMDRFLAGMAASADTYSPMSGTYTVELREHEKLRELIGQAIDETAARGDVVIVAHAASHALAANPDVLRVLVTGSPEVRRERVAAERGLDERGAARAVEAGDAARAAYLKSFHGAKRELPTDYDLVLNTDRLSVEAAAALVAVAAA